jgi:hypothetical protein
MFESIYVTADPIRDCESQAWADQAAGAQVFRYQEQALQAIAFAARKAA